MLMAMVILGESAFRWTRNLLAASLAAISAVVASKSLVVSTVVLGPGEHAVSSSSESSWRMTHNFDV